MPHPDGPKHHYIPVFYLNQWTGADGRLCEFSRPHKVVIARMKFPDATGYKRGLYTFTGMPIELSNFLEDEFFLRADDRAAPILRRLLNRDLDFDAQARSRWSRFIMTLFHRNPEAIARITKAVSGDFPKELEQVAANYQVLRQESDPPTFEEYRARMSPDALQRTILLVLQRVMDSKLIGDALNQMQWGVITVHRARYTLLTSDRPIVMSNGLGRPEAHLVMPIAPDKIFVAARSPEVMRQLDLRAQRGELLDELNSRMAQQARGFVYSVNSFQLRFVERRLGEHLKWSPWE
jgi:hypothetical protein